jgi:predicted transcriptional regulator
MVTYETRSVSDETKSVSNETIRVLKTAELARMAGVSVQYVNRLERAGVIKKLAFGKRPLRALGLIAEYRVHGGWMPRSDQP